MCLCVWRAELLYVLMKPMTMMHSPAVTPNAIACPRVRAAAEAVPLTMLTTRAGQHHAPIKAGMLLVGTRRCSTVRTQQTEAPGAAHLSMRVQRETQRERRDAFSPEQIKDQQDKQTDE